VRLTRSELNNPSEPFHEASLLSVCERVLTDLAASGLDGSIVTPDRVVSELAARQLRLVDRVQLDALGIGSSWVTRRSDRGLLHRVFRGVYLWGDPSPALESRALAAVFACGEGAVVGCSLAGALWGLRSVASGCVNVTVLGRRPRVRGITVQRVVRIDRRDLRTLRGIPVTSPARTLLDLAALLLGQQLARMLVGLLRQARLPAPAFNTKVEGLEVDAVWRVQRLVLEFDSHEFHATRAAFERDRRRDAKLTRAGHLTLRATWGELTQEPLFLVARIAEALALRRGRAAA
jgi:very-short-patch-repair endonuclease